MSTQEVNTGVNAVEVRTMGDVSLRIPAKPDFLHVVRAVVSGVGARQGLSYDAINELCLAASEAAAYLLGLTPGRASPGGAGSPSGCGRRTISTSPS